MDFIKKRIYLILIIGILILGFLIRHNNMYVWPRLGATFDEYAWTWQGMNIIQKGMPISWSPHPQYEDAKSIIYQQTHFRIVKPYLEHPPAFGIVAGSFAIIRGASNMYEVTLYHIRPLALILGVISIALVYLLVSQLYDKKTAVIASLLYATIPSVAVGSRLLQNENFFIPLYLFSLLLIHRFIKTRNPIYRNFAAIVCGILILAKIPWIAAAGAIIIILMYLKKYRDAMLFFLALIPFVLIYFTYGLYFDSRLFINLWTLQLNRYDIMFDSIFALFQKPFLTDRFYTDGWIYFGWIAFALLLIKELKKNYIIAFGLLSYFVIFMAGIPDEAGHGWYRYPFYPFLVISIAIFIRDYFAKNLILTFLFLAIVGASLFSHTWQTMFGFSYLLFRLLIIGWGLVMLPLFLPFKGLKKVSSAISYSWLVVFIVLNIWSVNSYNEQ